MPSRHDSEVAPWERQRRESDQAFRAFLHYRDAGEERSINKTAKALGKTRSMIANWCGKYAWTERVREWTNHLERESAALLIKKQARARERHQQMAEGHIAVLAPVAVALGRLRQSDGTLPNSPEARVLVRQAQLNAPALEKFVAVERMSLGMPSSQVAVTDASGGPVKVEMTPKRLVTFDPEQCTSDELVCLLAIAKRLESLPPKEE